MECVNLSVKTINLIDGNNIKLGVTIPDYWDEYTANSKPFISADKVYFGLGDHVCAYNLTIGKRTAPTNASWCADFDYEVPTGVVGYDK